MMAIGASDGFSRVVRMRTFRSDAFWPCRRRVGEGADDPPGLFVALAKDSPILNEMAAQMDDFAGKELKRRSCIAN